MSQKLSKAAVDALNAVTGKRARIVVDHILKYGSVSTDTLKETYGYDHPPRAIKDVSDQGIPLVKTIVRKDNGKRMAEYRFGDFDQIVAGRIGGRVNFSKAFKQSLVAEYGSRCGLCNALFESRYLQIDHRIPYAVADDDATTTRDVKEFMLVCGSCNSTKQRCCQECPNRIVSKNVKVCAVCYWANPVKYSHVATQDVRRLDLVWAGDEVLDFDAAKKKAVSADLSMPKFVKDVVRRAVQKIMPEE